MNQDGIRMYPIISIFVKYILNRIKISVIIYSENVFKVLLQQCTIYLIIYYHNIYICFCNSTP